MSTATESPPYLTLNEAASNLRVSRRHLFDLIKSGRIPAIRLGRSVRVPAEAIRPEALQTPLEEAPCPTKA